MRQVREFLFGDSVGRWKRKNPLLFALVIIAPTVLMLLFAAPINASSLAYVVGIWLAVAVVVFYVPLKIMGWMRRGRQD